MFVYKCEAGNYEVQCFAKKQSDLMKMVRRALLACLGSEGRRYVLHQYDCDYDTTNAPDFSWIDGKDFILLDGMEVLWVEGDDENP